MLYTTWKVKDNEYKLRLGARACVDLEKRLGTNPVNILMAVAQNNEVPQLTTMLTILQAAMEKFNHGIDMDKMYDIYDEYVDEGNTLVDLVPVVMDVFKNSGFFTEEKVETAAAKGKN